MKLTVKVDGGSLLADGQVIASVSGEIPVDDYVLEFITVDGAGAAARSRPQIADAEATVGDFTAAFVPGTAVYLRGNKFTGEGTVERTDGGDVLLRFHETGKLIRVFANEVSDMLTVTDGADSYSSAVPATNSSAYIPGPDGLTEGQTIYLDGDTFTGAATVETFKGGDAIVRMALDENSGRENVRIRINSGDYADQKVSLPVATPDTFSVGQAAHLDGVNFTGDGEIVKVTDNSVSIRLADGGGRRGRGTRLRVDANDLAAGRLVGA